MQLLDPFTSTEYLSLKYFLWIETQQCRNAKEQKADAVFNALFGRKSVTARHQSAVAAAGNFAQRGVDRAVLMIERVGLKCSLEHSTEGSDTHNGNQHSSASGCPRQNSIVAAPIEDTSAVYQDTLSRVYPAGFGGFGNIVDFLDILPSAGHNVAGDVEPYFQSFNKWLPVVDERCFYQRYDDPTNPPDQAFRTLQLACVLLSRISPPFTAADQPRSKELYVLINLSVIRLVSNGGSSLEVLQAKILLALYEHLTANHIAAVQSPQQLQLLGASVYYSGIVIPSQGEELSRIKHYIRSHGVYTFWNGKF
ncbi:LOW QUALITY PROTEIN: uncharacterized protein Z519_01987 [Cladophialophora bantiana CBS 173.52]|uniref:Transcription factor domain-containing protein n=1 Tax=Cladophialophora bantiana (strain ATCC 10958 / CBS 173.52 / CDC B-1940 / NIH 8579) TaxID=1442370 RepID=A0A0D2F307_CLAB1|nr:LOW QUALITY PROTEIN: uncharacterized protein Z519_01987 [Cladophialophora bantiana CBS 173.52]KIW96596.1 LOW QUALITY PROTEIN: hypothetical protein Z519_01987 [Cladophialophora bantiana CBS 173.52]